MNNIKKKLEGKVLIPALMWMAGAPFMLVVIVWWLFFRGR
jgi:hypothetical protein